jgi:hypothetical protein
VEPCRAQELVKERFRSLLSSSADDVRRLVVSEMER